MQVSIVSVVYSQSELLQKEVFLVELVDSIYKSKESMSHLKAVYFLRPTSDNVQHLRRHLASPRFGEYHLCRFLIFFGISEKPYCNLFLTWELVVLSPSLLIIFSHQFEELCENILKLQFSPTY